MSRTILFAVDLAAIAVMVFALYFPGTAGATWSSPTSS